MASSPHITITEGRLSVELLEQLASVAPVMLWVSDVEQRFRWLNRFAARFLGLEPDTELGLPCLDVVHPEDRAACQATYAAALEAQRPFKLEYRARHASGDYRWVFSHGVPHFNATGDFLGFVGTCIDVQELKSTQSELRREHTFLERLIDFSDRESEAMASSLHDRVLQPLLAAKMHIQSLSPDETAIARTETNLDLASQLLSSVAEECLQIINRTRPLIIDEQGVQVAIQDLLAELNEHCDTRFDLVCHSQLGRFPRLWEGSLYWLVSEALQNVVRHANAARATVQLSADHSGVTISICDDGCGFDPGAVADEAFGLKAIQERALLFGGRCTLESAVGAGTKLSITIPLPHALDD